MIARPEMQIKKRANFLNLAMRTFSPYLYCSQIVIVGTAQSVSWGSHWFDIWMTITKKETIVLHLYNSYVISRNNHPSDHKVATWYQLRESWHQKMSNFVPKDIWRQTRRLVEALGTKLENEPMAWRSRKRWWIRSGLNYIYVVFTMIFTLYRYNRY